MQTHQLQPKHKTHNKKRIGRGGKKGTYSGKGMKGQTSRAGRKMMPFVREIIKRYPKLKGYRAFVPEDLTAVVNLDILEKNAKEGQTITPNTLVKLGIVKQIKGFTPKVKILGRGKFSKKLTIEKCFISKTAKESIEKAGGKVK
jgi:large subunit ribosomal protein L15